ncbi:hypothetical protein F4782DRAFT_547317 [Xylaria castorea]|nr:hypothetical protein F4782DRAFT_547317 [Xylaria castorea]
MEQPHGSSSRYSSSGPLQRLSQQPSNTDYDSENEANPRVIIDSNVKFYVDHTVTPPMEFWEFLLHFPNGDFDALRPVPCPTDVAYVRLRMRRGATRFKVIDSLQSMFALRNAKTIGSTVVRRFCLRRIFVTGQLHSKTMLIYTDGAARTTYRNLTGRSQAATAGGCAFKFGDSDGDTVAFPLEAAGPDGDQHTPTSSRTPFRAALAALRFKDWYREGWTRVVVQTTYNRFLQSAMNPSAYLGDLARELNKILEEYVENGCEVSFVPMLRGSLEDSALSPEVADRQTQQRIIPTSYQARPRNCIHDPI